MIYTNRLFTPCKFTHTAPPTELVDICLTRIIVFGIKINDDRTSSIITSGKPNQTVNIWTPEPRSVYHLRSRKFLFNYLCIHINTTKTKHIVFFFWFYKQQYTTCNVFLVLLNNPWFYESVFTASFHIAN